MMNNKWIKIFVLLTAVVFLSTTVYARSSKSDSKKHSYSWWRAPFYQLWKTTKNLKKQVRKVQIQNRNLKKKVAALEEKVESLQGPGGSNTASPLICPGCNFSDNTSNQSAKSFAESEPVYEECTGVWAGYDFSGAYMDNTYFSNACLNDSVFKNSMLRSTYFAWAQLKRADFSGADLTGAWLAGANLEGAVFKDTVLDGVVWHSMGYDDTICPDGYLATDHYNTDCMDDVYPDALPNP